MEFFLRVIIAPGFLAAISAVVAPAFGATAPFVVLFIIFWLIWLVVINGGFVILDDDWFH